MAYDGYSSVRTEGTASARIKAKKELPALSLPRLSLYHGLHYPPHELLSYLPTNADVMVAGLVTAATGVAVRRAVT